MSDPWDSDDDDYIQLKDQVKDLLDLVVRPIGTFDARLPHTAESSRQLIALYDAIGKNL